jgi:DNA polymerase III subunit delta'
VSGAGAAPWQDALLERLVAAHEAGRLGHGLLLVGPEGIGKHAVAEALAARLLCTSPEAGRACGRCRSCRFRLAGTHPDHRHVSFEVNEKTGKLRTEIIIDQMRRLSEWFALTPQLGGAQVAVVTPAERLNRSAANSLLKTLEEPAGNRYLLLVTASPHKLAATIRSRCQRFELRPPARDAALAWLRQQGLGSPEPALDAARGNPGLAAQWAASGVLDLRQEVITGLTDVATGRASALELARAWAADESLDLRLQMAAEHAQQLCAALQGLGEGGRLTASADFQKLSAWFDAANRLRGLLGTTVRLDLSVAGLLRDWRLACVGQ